MKATVAIIMGSASDFGIMKDAKELLESFENLPNSSTTTCLIFMLATSIAILVYMAVMIDLSL